MKQNFQRKYHRNSQRIQDKKRKNEFIKLLKRKTKPHLIPISFIFIAVLFLFVIVGQIKRTHNIYTQVDELKDEFNQIEQDNKNTEAQINNLESSGAIDKEARERLNLKKEGEEVVVIIPPETSGESEIQFEEPQKKSFWNKFLDFFR